MLVLLIATYGCQTANNTITPETSVANLQSNKEATATEKSTEIDKKSLTELQKRLVRNWLGAGGHGGVHISRPAGEEVKTAEKAADKVTGKSGKIEKGPFAELEKNVVGSWLNLKETESIEFLDDGTIIITDKEGDKPKLKGDYKFLDKGRLRVDFKGDFYANLIPSMHFKIAISENEITLTDEPDGAATTYKRIK